MKKIIFTLLIGMFALVGQAQTVMTVGATGATHTTLKAAFDVINLETTGTFHIQIVDNTTETASAVLSKSGLTVLIYPTVTGKTISGNINAILINLSAVSNVTIDGRLRNTSGVVTGSTPDLTIDNADATATSPAATTITISGAATYNKITYCIIKGSNGQSATAGGIVTISGNASQSNNEISYNKITASTNGRPQNSVFISNNTTGLKIINNNFENAVNGSGVRSHQGINDIEISGNSFYETATFTPTRPVIYININSNDETRTANNVVISNNYIGGSGPQCEGMLSKSGIKNACKGIEITNVKTSTGFTVSNNSIKNITWINSNGDDNENWNFSGILFNPSLSSVAPDAISHIHSNFISNITYYRSTAGYIGATGIHYNKKNAAIYNNIVSLGTNHRAQIWGIRLNGEANANSNCQVYNNTVYISGEQPATGNELSYAFRSASNAFTRDVRNNIFINARTRAGGSSRHFATYFQYNAMLPDPNPNGATFTWDYNDYYVTGTGGVLGNFRSVTTTDNAAEDITTLAAMQTATGGDANSTVDNPSITPNLTPESFKGLTALTGTSIDVITTDFAGNIRRANQMGAYFIPSSVSVTSGTINSSDLSLTPASQIEVAAGAELNLNSVPDISKIIVAPTGKLSMNGNSITAPNGVVLQSDATGTATLTGDNAVTNATVQQHVTAGRNWYMSAPISSAAYSSLNLGEKVVQWNESSKTWSDVVSGSLATGRGYIQVANANQGTTGTVNFTGTSNAGNIDVAVSRTESGASRGFNLVGNPYPSYLNWTDFIANTNNADAVLNSFWFRTKNNSNQYVFTTYNGTSHEVVGGSGVPTSLNAYIPPMQAFWVRVKQNTDGNDSNYPNNNTSIRFANNMRTHADAAGNNSNNRLKTPTNNPRTRLRLQLANGTAVDEALIYFDAGADNGFDNYDSPKMHNNSTTMPDIYSKTGDERLVINGLNRIIDNMAIPLGFTLRTAGTLNFKVSEMSNFDSNIKVYLLDNALATQTELSAGTEFSFSTTEATTNNESRFSLLFRAAGISTTTQNTNNTTAKTYVNTNQQIVIEASSKSTYAIYNTMGQLIDNGKLNTEHETLNTKLAAGVYIVKVGRVTQILTIR